MFGRRIEKYCPQCQSDKKVDVSVSFCIDGKHYYDLMYCPTCNSDLAKEDRKVIKEAKDNGESFGVSMF